MTQEQAVEEAKQIVASIPATKDKPEVSIRVPDQDSTGSLFWIVTFKQEEYSEMDDRGFWMDLIKWEFENATRE
nr:hypothetical protein [uncultured Dyadobacter sp.]